MQKTCAHLSGTLNYFRVGADVLIRLSDIVDAIDIYNSLKASHPGWSVEFITPALFAEVFQRTKFSLDKPSAYFS